MKTTLSDRLIVGNTSYDELTDRWFSLRLDGKYAEARELKQYMARVADLSPVSAGGVNSASVAPAAGGTNTTSTTGQTSPLPANRGGTNNPQPHINRQNLSKIISATRKDSITIIDWVTATFHALENEERLVGLRSELDDLLLDHEIEIKPRQKGLYSYPNSALLHVPNDSGDGHNCGFLAWNDDPKNLGLMIELTGTGCEFLRGRGEYDGLVELYSVLLIYSGRISRVDTALDLEHDYCMPRGITVPALASCGYAGEFRSDFSPSHVKQQFNQQGDWSEVMFNGLPVAQYNPEINAPAGLSFYLGTSKSDNQLVFYEKGKQLLGAISGLSESESAELKELAGMDSRNEKQQERFTKLADKSGYDSQYEGKKGWVRIERRLRRKSSKKIIDPAVLLDPDSFFCMGFKGLRVALDDYSEWLTGEYADLQSYHHSRVEKVKDVTLSKKIHWAKMQAGSLIRTLIAEGYNEDRILDALKREIGLKHYIFDLIS